MRMSRHNVFQPSSEGQVTTVLSGIHIPVQRIDKEGRILLQRVDRAQPMTIPNIEFPAKALALKTTVIATLERDVLAEGNHLYHQLVMKNSKCFVNLNEGARARMRKDWTITTSQIVRHEFSRTPTMTPLRGEKYSYKNKHNSHRRRLDLRTGEETGYGRSPTLPIQSLHHQ